MTDSAPPPGSGDDEPAQELSRWPRWSSDLHESLASHEARAAQLREELEDLRRSLDAAPGGTPASGAHRRPKRRALVAGGVLGGGALLAAALGAVAAARAGAPAPASRASSGASTAARPSTSHSPSPSSSPSSSPSGSSASPSVAAAVPPLPAWPGAQGPQPPGLPARGVGVDAPGTDVTAAIAADRSGAEVYERAVLDAGSTLLLRPAPAPDLARSLGAPLPTVTDLHAEIDGTPVPVVQGASGWRVTAPAGGTVRHLALRYHLRGALIRPQPAPPGRYALVLTPLAPSAGRGAEAGVVVRIDDPRVEEVYCPAARDQLCGRVDGAVHVATVPAGARPVVVALVTFPT